ncbi:hypothetical protein [Caproiciproducens sp.]
MEQLHEGYIGIKNFANEIYGLIAIEKTETRETIYNKMWEGKLVQYIFDKYRDDMRDYELDKRCDIKFWEQEFFQATGYVKSLPANNCENGLLLITSVIMSWLEEPKVKQ